VRWDGPDFSGFAGFVRRIERQPSKLGSTTARVDTGFGSGSRRAELAPLYVRAVAAMTVSESGTDQPDETWRTRHAQAAAADRMPRRDVTPAMIPRQTIRQWSLEPR
jgi:hypothetical protein